MADQADDLLSKIATALAGDGDPDARLQAALQKVISAFDCAVGTIHSLDAASGTLALRAHRGIPDAIMDKVRLIPIGKGMAGLAAARREPVQVCNLQTDDSGLAKPGAKLTQMEGSIAAPMLVGDKLCGTIGVAKPTPYEFSRDEAERLMRAGGVIGAYILNDGSPKPISSPQ